VDDLTVLRSAYGRLRALAAATTPHDLSRPTPCADWDVRALLDHVVAGQGGLVAVLRGDAPDWSDGDRLGDDPAGAVDAALEAALAAFSAPGAVEATSEKLPGMRIVDFAAADAVVHGWDLATAVGRTLDLPDDVVRVVHDRWSGGAAETGRQYGAFGPEVPVQEDRPLLDRLVGALGRDPDWRPPA
jgi:uncharacterized protein (TIGR03086 family)